jgi:transcription elongation factor SPT5
VRIRRGIYAGDLAYVRGVDEDLDEVIVALVPRIHLGPKKKRKIKGSGFARPPASLFDATIIRQHYGPDSVVDKGDSLIFKKKRYTSRLLVLKLHATLAVMLESSPIVDELVPFVESMIDPPEIDSLFECLLWLVGDTLEVLGGFYKGDRGSLQSVDVECKVATVDFGRIVVDIRCRLLRRVFPNGADVVVVAGCHKRRHGTVISTQFNKVTFVEDKTIEHVRHIFSCIY